MNTCMCMYWYQCINHVHVCLNQIFKPYTHLYYIHTYRYRPSMYIEVDFPEVTSRKCHLIKTKHQLLDPLKQDGYTDTTGKSLIVSGHLLVFIYMNFTRNELKFKLLYLCICTF